MGRSQQGNNNAYCQDNPISWVNWNLQPDPASPMLQPNHESLLDFTRQLVAFRRCHPVFRRRRWFQGRAIHGSEVHDIGWFNPDGKPMTEEQWNIGFAKAIAIFLTGSELAEPGERGERIMDESFLLFFNAHFEAIDFLIPNGLQHWHWQTIIDTTQPRFLDYGAWYTADKVIPVTDRSMIVLKRGG